MASTTLVPIEEFLANINGKYAYSEYVDGVLIEKPVAGSLHGILQMWFGYLFARYRQQYAAASELHSRVRPTEFRIPDVAVQRRGIMFAESYGQTPYILAIEILSPGGTIRTTFAKCEIYHRWGVPYCWVLDPEKRSAWTYNNGDEPRRMDDSIEAGDIRFTLAEVWQGLDPQS
jgi:Uma2 family endonuclease